MSSYSESKRITINIDMEDWPLYEDLKGSKWNFDKNIHLFTIATLIGKSNSIRKKINKQKSYFRVSDNNNHDDMVILKALAISEVNDVKIMESEDDMFTICEEYARSGIKILHDLYVNPSKNLDVFISELLLKESKNLNLDKK